ncbi:MAG: DUF4340 domain-containing protein, partial [Myxococcota bacterium]
GLIVQAVLAVGGLLAAYFVWTDDTSGGGAEGQVMIWDCDADEVSTVRLQSKRAKVTLERRGEGDDAHWWVVYVDRPEEGEPTTTQFTGAERVEDYLEDLAPLRATRQVGELDEESLEAVGLARPEDELVVTCGGNERTFVAGENAFGSGDRYLRDARGGAIYLVDANVVRDLLSARARLMQRQLHTFDWTDVARLKVEGSGEEKVLLQRNRHDRRKAEWVDAAEPDRRNELYDNWFDRLRRLSVSEYLDPNEDPGEGMDVQPVATLTFEGGEGEELDRWKLVRAVAPDDVQYFARSRATRSWVEMPPSVAKQVSREVRPVLGLEAVDEPEPARPAAPAQAGPGGEPPPDGEPSGGNAQSPGGGSPGADEQPPDGEPSPGSEQSPGGQPTGLPPGHP